MDITYYAFATYIFLLVCAAIWFFNKVSRGAKGKGDKSAYEKEQRLFTLYQNVEDMMSGFEEYAEETKKDTEAALTKAVRMLEEIRQLSKEMKGMKAGAEAAAQKATPKGIQWNGPQEGLTESRPEIPEPAQRAAARPAQTGGAKTEEQAAPPLKTNEKIQLLNAQGFSATEIAKTLGISVREVTLALEMLRK